MADYDSVRQRIVSSVFPRLNVNGAPEQTYVAHLKVWEEAGAEGGANKPRYIIVSQAGSDGGFVHKSKLNTNGSFSVGKTWNLAELRAVKVQNPLAFSITLARTYRWQTENQKDQTRFITALVKAFRAVSGYSAALQIEGFREIDPMPVSRQPVQTDSVRTTRTPSPANGLPSRVAPRRPGQRSDLVQDDHQSLPRNSSPAVIRPPQRSSEFSSRASSPASGRGVISTPVKNDARVAEHSRPPSPGSQSSASAPRSRQARRPSNAASTSSQIPSINLPSPPLTSQSSVAVPKTAPRAVAGMASTSRPSLDIPSQLMPASHSNSSPVSNYSPALSSRTPRGDVVRIPSPAPSSRSGKYSARATTPLGHETQGQGRREHNARISFYDPVNQALLDRLLARGPGSQDDMEEEEENARATMATVEEMLEGYQWASDDVIGRRAARGTADLIEARLKDELMALERANIYSFLESDDRVESVLKYMDEAIAEFDNIESLLSSYKIHLNAVSDDILHIQSQNRGLQVQTQNQRALLNELTNLLQTVHVSREALSALTQESLEKQQGIQRLEEAATELYKALQAGRDRDMAATMERFDEYRTHNAQFCKRVYDFLSIMATAQVSMLLGDNQGISKKNAGGRPAIVNHGELEKYLGRYAGLILYLKEMDEPTYGKLCAAYFSAASDLHSKQVKALLTLYAKLVKKSTDDDPEFSFTSAPVQPAFKTPSGIRRAGTLIRSPMDSRKDKDKRPDGELFVPDALEQVLEQIAPQIYRENDFIADFLQINEAGLTFADYMNLENYFRRQATMSGGLSQATVKLIRGAMDLIFGFLPTELKAWLDSVLTKDRLQIVGVIATLERFLAEADERGNSFFLQALEKQHSRLKGLFDRQIAGHLKSIQDIKMTSKKRIGVAPFINYFPIFVSRIESQLPGADGLEVRATVDVAYEKIVQAMFDCLKQMAKFSGEGEDKGQLNYHVILIENTHFFVAETSQLELGSLVAFIKRAEGIYEENLSAYVKIVIRRPFGKIIDFFEGIERLLKSTAPTEVPNNPGYNRSALKKVVKEYNAKDVRKHVDALFKRVEKHFTEASEKATTEESGGIIPGTVMVGVWKACQDELQRIHDFFENRIAQCYGDSGTQLEFTAADIESTFRRHSVVS